MTASAKAVAGSLSASATVPVTCIRTKGDFDFFLARRDTSNTSLSTPAHRTLRREVLSLGHFSRRALRERERMTRECTYCLRRARPRGLCPSRRTWRRSRRSQGPARGWTWRARGSDVASGGPDGECSEEGALTEKRKTRRRWPQWALEFCASPELVRPRARVAARWAPNAQRVPDVTHAVMGGVTGHRGSHSTRECRSLRVTLPRGGRRRAPNSGLAPDASLPLPPSPRRTPHP